MPDRRKIATTHGALAFIAAKILGELEPADTASSAISQVEKVLSRVSKTAIAKAGKLGRSDISKGISLGSYKLKGLEDKAYTFMQTAHLTFIGDNGSIMIAAVPSAEEMIRIIENDPVAMRAIDSIRPVEVQGVTTMGKKINLQLNARETRQHLAEMAQGKHQDLTKESGWKEIHTLLERIPFNYQAHLRSGRLKVQFSKPGKKGLDFLEWLEAGESPHRYA